MKQNTEINEDNQQKQQTVSGHVEPVVSRKTIWQVTAKDWFVFKYEEGGSIGEAIDDFFDSTSYKQSEIKSVIDISC